MQFSKTELEVISHIGNGNKEVIGIAKTLKISISQSYRIATKLSEKGIIRLKDGILHPEMKTHVNMLLKSLSSAINLSIPLSGTGIQVYLSLLTPKRIKEVEKETGLHKTTVIKKINQGRKMSLLIVEDKTYNLNGKIWPDLRECLYELEKYEESIDFRIPVNSMIYFKKREEIIFSVKEEIDAEKTAFSAYERYGIKLLLITNYYYLPKRHLSKEDVFMHSLYVAEKNKDAKNIIFTALFMAKYKKELSGIKHPIVENLNRIFSGEKMAGYPSLAEIKDRAAIYDLKV